METYCRHVCARCGSIVSCYSKECVLPLLVDSGQDGTHSDCLPMQKYLARTGGIIEETVREQITILQGHLLNPNRKVVISWHR